MTSPQNDSNSYEMQEMSMSASSSKIIKEIPTCKPQLVLSILGKKSILNIFDFESSQALQLQTEIGSELYQRIIKETQVLKTKIKMK